MCEYVLGWLCKYVIREKRIILSKVSFNLLLGVFIFFFFVVKKIGMFDCMLELVLNYFFCCEKKLGCLIVG